MKLTTKQLKILIKEEIDKLYEAKKPVESRKGNGPRLTRVSKQKAWHYLPQRALHSLEGGESFGLDSENQLWIRDQHTGEFLTWDHHRGTWMDYNELVTGAYDFVYKESKVKPATKKPRPSRRWLGHRKTVESIADAYLADSGIWINELEDFGFNQGFSIPELRSLLDDELGMSAIVSQVAKEKGVDPSKLKELVFVNLDSVLENQEDDYEDDY